MKAYTKEELEKLNDEDIVDIISELESLDEVEYIEENCNTLKYIDEVIDDGCDDEDDEYIIKRVYSIGKFDIRVYFGNNSRKIGWVRVDN